MKHEKLINAVLDSLLQKAKNNQLLWKKENCSIGYRYFVYINFDDGRYDGTVYVKKENNAYICKIAMGTNTSYPSVLTIKETETSCETKSHQIEKLYRHASRYIQSIQDEHDEKLLKYLLEKLNS